jgi:hypothetical protein
MRVTIVHTLPLLLLCALPAPASAQAPAMDPATCPMHEQHMKDQKLDQRGDAHMGFGHDRTTHHFLITETGGAIQVAANDAADSESRDQIRRHLAEIAGKFAAGDFAAPKAIHDRVLPGVPEMIERKDAINWRYEEMERGGQVVITTADPQALAAVHEFLQAQIVDHRTGDTMGNHALLAPPPEPAKQ